LGSKEDNFIRNRFIPVVKKIKKELGLIETISLERVVSDAANAAAKREKLSELDADLFV
jgi:hypothetical protein